MKKICFLLVVFCTAFYGTLQAQPKKINKAFELAMPKTADDPFCGTRGASVAWDPAGKKYYAGFAGNMAFPLAVFDASGKLLTDTSLHTMQDIRALWYNPLTKKISGNCYNDGGWFSYETTAKGIPSNIKTEVNGMYQPDENSAGAFDPVSKSVLFLAAGKLAFYRANSATPWKKLNIQWGRPKILGPAFFDEMDEIPADYNFTTVVYTGIPNAQLAFLNVSKYQIELYDYTEGYLQQILELPDGAPIHSSFNFAFANGYYWLFDIDNRKWIAYK